jgi:NADH pyrophosphatase NudC (nudix superfamily)
VALQKKVKNYNRASWLPEAKRTLYLANMAKYSQNTDARDALLKTRDNLIGEASYNRTWGIGTSIRDPQAFHGNWVGQNFMGNILMEIRHVLDPNQHAKGYKSPSTVHEQKSCWFCGETNHISTNCRHGHQIQCRACGQYGHKEKSCHYSFPYNYSY